MLPVSSRTNLAEGLSLHAAPLEEAVATSVRDTAAALAFALFRLPPDDRRPFLFAAPRWWINEHGRPFSQGWRESDQVLVAVRTAQEVLWAMEQALRSGAVRGVIGAAVEDASLAQSRRLEFAAREGGATGVLLRGREGGLSAARRRWRISAAGSAANPLDPRAPGAFRIRAELVRSRSEPPGVWMLEQDDETHRLRLADRLAGDGLVENARTAAAA